MTKQGKVGIILTAILLILLIIVATVYITGKEVPKSDISSEVVVSDISSSVKVEDIEDKTEEAESVEIESEEGFIVPDETKADEILENTSPEKNTSSKTEKEEPKVEILESKEEDTQIQTFEEGKQELENTSLDYLKEHNIDPKTAGETGELCPNCGKKIWNPDKYGFYIPGMPKDYENSGYCIGTCGISLE